MITKQNIISTLDWLWVIWFFWILLAIPYFYIKTIVSIHNAYEIKEQSKNKEYNVKIEYCNSSKTENVVVISKSEPNNNSIRTFRVALPEIQTKTWLKINVCNLTVIK